MHAGIKRGMVTFMMWAIVSILTVASAVHAQVTEVTLDSSVTSAIPGLSITPGGTYTVPGPLALPQTGFSEDLLSHDGGAFVFGSSATANTYTYGDWVYELLDTCAADGDACEVDTSGGNAAPWAVRNYDAQAGTAELVFTEAGAQQFNDLQGITVTTPYITVFVTNSATNANLGGLSGADTLCTNVAATAGLQGQWTAWLSDSTTDARDRINDGEYRLPDRATIVASSLDDLTDGTLSNPINQTADGTMVGGGNPWTGTQPDGTLAEGTANEVACDDWTNDGGSSGTGVVGDSGEVNESWTETAGSAQCVSSQQLYCFSRRFLPEAPFATTFVPMPVPVPTMEGGARAALVLALLAVASGLLWTYRRA